MNRWWARQIDEIVASLALRVFGFFLAFTHLLTFLFHTDRFSESLLESYSENPICWPFLPNCESYRLSGGALTVAGYLYFSGALIAMVLFLIANTKRDVRRQILSWALAALAILTVFKFVLVLQDYRMMGNYHYMAAIASIAYLCLPLKKDLLRALIVSFYIGSGLLKLNREWLSGAAIFTNHWLSETRFELLACAGVVLLELIGAQFLLFSRHLARWFALVSLLLFHAYSWHIVGFFYPLVMGSLLAIFPIVWWEEKSESVFAGSLLGRIVKSRLAVAALGIYWFAQVIPLAQEAFTGHDPALYSEGRLFALNMFDSNPECTWFLLVRYKGLTVDVSDPARVYAPRIRCDPWIYFQEAKRQCRAGEKDSRFIDVDLYLNSRRRGEKNFKQLIGITDFCKRDLSYSTFWPNRWIK